MASNSTVLADGCFDPLHAGHIAYLQTAAQFGDRLIVNVAPDEAIRAKGREPFQTLHERLRTIAALRCVSHVSSMPLWYAVRRYSPHVLVKGGDWEDKLPADVVQECGEHATQIVFTDTVTKSSTERLDDRR